MLVGGVMAPVRGDYEFLGEGMPIFFPRRLAHRLKLGLVFDGGCLFNQLTVAENIALLFVLSSQPLRGSSRSKCRHADRVDGVVAALRPIPGAQGRNWQRRAGASAGADPETRCCCSIRRFPGSTSVNKIGGSTQGQLSRGHPYYEGRPVTIATTASLPELARAGV